MRAFFCADFGTAECFLSPIHICRFVPLQQLPPCICCFFLRFYPCFFRFPIDSSHPAWYTEDKEGIKDSLSVTTPFFLRMETWGMAYGIRTDASAALPANGCTGNRHAVSAPVDHGKRTGYMTEPTAYLPHGIRPVQPVRADQQAP